MICADVLDNAFDRLYGLLDGEAQAAFDAHLAGCASCGAAFKRASEQRTLLRAEERPAPPRGLAERTLRRLRPRRATFRAVAAAVLLLGVGAWMLSGSRGLSWVSGDVRRRVAEGERVTATAEGTLEFPDGSRLLLRPGACVQAAPRGRRSAVLEAGEISCRVAPAAERFVIATPAADVTVLGTEFQLRLTGESDMDRKTAIGSGLLLTVAVATGAVLVANSGGEVTLGADEAAAARPGVAPQRILEAELRRAEEEARAVGREADALQAQSDDLRRAGRLLLAEYHRRSKAPAAAQAPTPAVPQAFSGLMRAQMKVGMKAQTKKEVDKLDALVRLSPEQRAAVEACYERVYDKLIDSIARGDFDALEEKGGALSLDLAANFEKILRPDQMDLYRKAQAEEAEKSRLKQEKENRKAFETAAEAMGLAEEQRAALEPRLSPVLERLSEQGARLFVRAMTGQMPFEQLREKQDALVQTAAEELKDGLSPAQLDAFRAHARKLMTPDRITVGSKK
jgi:hypothetical protein